MLPTDHGDTAILGESRLLDRTVVPALTAAFLAVLAASFITIVALQLGHGYPLIQPCAAVLLIFVVCSRRSLRGSYLLVGMLAEITAAVLVGETRRGILHAVGDVLEIGIITQVYFALRHHGLRVGHIVSFFASMAIAGLVAPALGATVVALLVSLTHGTPFADVWLARFVGDATAIITLTPPVVAVRNGDLLRASRRGMLAETALMLVGGIALTVFLFGFVTFPVTFLLFSYLLVAVFRLPLTGAFLVMLGVLATAIAYTLVPGIGLLDLEFPLLERIVAVQLFLATSVLTIMPVAMVLHERELLAGDVAAARDEAERANRSKSEFLAAMSHEIRTPMNGIIGFSELLRESRLTAEQRSQLLMIEDAGQSLLTIINDILDISSAEQGRINILAAPHDPAVLVASVGSLLRRDAGARGLTLLLDVPDDLPRLVLGDAARLRQVLLNLVSNAVKFTTQGGSDGSGPAGWGLAASVPLRGARYRRGVDRQGAGEACSRHSCASTITRRCGLAAAAWAWPSASA